VKCGVINSVIKYWIENILHKLILALPRGDIFSFYVTISITSTPRALAILPTVAGCTLLALR